jgi:hypothetical protein
VVEREAATMPEETVQVALNATPREAVFTVQLVSYGLNPLPETPTEKPGVTVLGVIVMLAEGVPTWNVVPAQNPSESVTLTT